jgi:hypothetical protein
LVQRLYSGAEQRSQPEKSSGENVTGPRAVDDFAAIRARAEELRHENAQVRGPTTLPPAGASETLLH